jgi:hypothetical protein
MRRILCSLAIFLAVDLHAQNPGDLDLSFDGDGKLVIADIDSMGDPFAVPTSDLGLIIGFNRTVDGQQQTCLLRLNEDGSVNTSFGVQGLAVSTTPMLLKGLQLAPDGAVLVVGLVPDQYLLRVQRYLDTGVLDLAFASQGMAEVVLPSASFWSPTHVASTLLLPDQRLLVSGQYGIARLTEIGALDASFGPGGIAGTGPRGAMTITDGSIYSTTISQCGQDVYADYDGTFASGTYCLTNPYSQSNGWRLNGHLISAPNGRLFGTSMNNFSAYDVSRHFSSFDPAFLEVGPDAFQYTPTVQPQFFDRMSPFGNQTEKYTCAALATDAQGSFYAFYSRRGRQFSSSDGSYTVFYPSGWSIKKFDDNGELVPFSAGIDSILTNFNELTVATSDNDFPRPTALVTAANGRLVGVGVALLDGVWRIVAARYHATPDPRSRANIRLFLGGNYDPATGLMHDSLRTAGLVPQLTPYDAPHFLMANGRGAFATPASVLAVEGDSAVVDWVWLELMRDTLPGNVVATRVGLLHRNGWVTAADGRSPIDFGIGAGNYLLRARHRNHLSATTSSAITLGVDPVTVDLTDPATVTFGTAAQMEVNGVRMLWPGETNNDGLVRYAGSMNDRDRVLQAIGGTVPTATVTGYLVTDVNLDGVVKYAGSTNDRDVIVQTIGGTVPTAVRIEQVP